MVKPIPMNILASFQTTGTSLVLMLLLLPHMASAVVVGELSRMQVNQTDSATYRVYGQVEDFCSGTMISSRLVLTAAHCVYDRKNQSFLPVRTFTPGKNGDIAPFGVIPVEKILMNPAYIQGDLSQDLAVLVLQTPIGLRTGWLDIAWDLSVLAPHPSALGGWSAPGTIAGYPGDKAEGTMWLVACSFYVPNLVPRRPQYTCDTFGGMSGSALVAAGAQGRSLIFGVHTSGHVFNNSGVVLTGPNKAFLQSVMSLYPL